jgi:type III secretion protein U
MSGEKTEQPTSKKLRDARRKGQVPKSKDFTQTALVLALFGYLLAAGGSLMRAFAQLLLMPMDFIDKPFRDVLGTVLGHAVHDGAALVLPFLVIVLLVGVFAEALQVGVLFAFEALKPSAKKLNPIDNAKNMFSKKSLVEFLKNLLKVAFLGALLWTVIRRQLPQLLTLPGAGIEGVGQAISLLLRQIVVQVALAYAVVAIADLLWQRYSYRKGLMMSKEEVKQEYKEAEGDAHVKGARKHFHQELLMSGGSQKVKQASVVVTNPTHIAVALLYEEARTPLPLVVAMGTDHVAQHMKAIAREAGVPVMENVPLARALHATAEVDRYVPSELLEPVAHVLQLVRELAQARADEGGQDAAPAP